MATKIKKEDFDRYTVNGFKIGDVIEIKEADVQAEIIAVDLDKYSLYRIMIDATQINLNDDDFIDIPIEDCRNETVYYRKKALKKKYKIWVNADKVEHVYDTNTRENVLENRQEEPVNEEDSSSDDDAFMIEDYLKDDSDIYSEFFLKSKYGNTIWSDQCWSNETYTDMQSLVEVNRYDAEYIAIVFDSNCSLNNGRLLDALLASADRTSKMSQFDKIIVDNISQVDNATTIKDLIAIIVEDLYAEDIIHSYRWNSDGMCAVLVKL